MQSKSRLTGACIEPCMNMILRRIFNMVCFLRLAHPSQAVLFFWQGTSRYTPNHSVQLPVNSPGGRGATEGGAWQALGHVFLCCSCDMMLCWSSKMSFNPCVNIVHLYMSIAGDRVSLAFTPELIQQFGQQSGRCEQAWDINVNFWYFTYMSH